MHAGGCYLQARGVEHSNRSLISSGLAARLSDVRINALMTASHLGFGLGQSKSNLQDHNNVERSPGKPLTIFTYLTRASSDSRYDLRVDE
jgi:hypothetical protein